MDRALRRYTKPTASFTSLPRRHPGQTHGCNVDPCLSPGLMKSGKAISYKESKFSVRLK